MSGRSGKRLRRNAREKFEPPPGRWYGAELRTSRQRPLDRKIVRVEVQCEQDLPLRRLHGSGRRIDSVRDGVPDRESNERRPEALGIIRQEPVDVRREQVRLPGISERRAKLAGNG